MKISICIPTFNRANYLTNCLNSILLCKVNSKVDFQVCVSDNCSTDETEKLVQSTQMKLNIKYYKSSENIGRVRNYMNVIDMADGEFVWLLGDDDLLLPHTVDKLNALICKHKSIDYFYINSFHLSTQYVLSFPQPFNINNLPEDMIPFSSYPYSGELPFLDLVNPKISFDFLGGMFLAVFKRQKWIENVNVLDENAISDPREFSHFDNTFPHLKIFAKAFAKSKAYFHAEPLSVCLTGAREWASMYPFVQSVRLVDALYEYRKNGLPLLQFLNCKNYALNNFIPDFILMLKNKHESGLNYTNPFKLVFGNCLYPNFYLSPFYYIYKKIKLLILRKMAIAKKSNSSFLKNLC